MAALLTIEEKGLTLAIEKIDKVEGALQFELSDGLGRLIQRQTRRRIKDEKTSPTGASWPQNKAGSSTLYKSGALERSVDYKASPSQIIVGSGIAYAAIHHYGGVIKPKNARALRFQIGNRVVFSKKVTIPARPYLGVSADNKEEIVETVEDFLERALQ